MGLVTLVSSIALTCRFRSVKVGNVMSLLRNLVRRMPRVFLLLGWAAMSAIPTETKVKEAHCADETYILIFNIVRTHVF